MEKLLKFRAEMKKKKPVFARQESHVRKRLGTSWRRPRGIHSKMREKRAGKHAQVRAGYRMPRAVRGLHKTGLIEVHVSNPQQLETIKKDTQIAVFSSVTGNRKKQIMLKKAIELGIKIANIKNPNKELEKIEAGLKERKEKKKTKKAEKKKPEAKAQPAEKKKEEPKKQPAEKTEEKPAEKKEEVKA